MSATSVEIDTKDIHNALSASPSISRVNTTLSYYRLLSTNIRTLSTTGASVGASPNGLIYVPELDPGSTCINSTAQYIPQNVTRVGDVPTGYSLIAVAPWTSPDCVQAFFSAARDDLYVRAFIWYLPNGQPGAEPPAPNDPAWLLNDGGQWKRDNQYPVYAVPPDLGQDVINNSNLYSGNISSIPNANLLASSYDPRDYIRLFMVINLSLTSGLPSLWIFLVIILAILVSVVGIVSIVMHFLQRHRRADLRRRVANGEVDLETLGVKRLMVPQVLLDKMPLYTYEKTGQTAPASSSLESLRDPAASPEAPGIRSADHEKTNGITNSPKSKSTAPLNHFDQPTCAICLDDFVAGESQVRQLPCEHIFHPECIDTFLKRTSSLCPLCKKSALPSGFCPDMITNAMVRRERILRRARQRADRLGLNEGDARAALAHRRLIQLRRRFDRSRTDDVEMNATRPAVSAAAVNSPPTATSDRPAARNSEERRQRAAARAEAILGPDAAPRDLEVQEQSSDPTWKRGLRRVFPSVR